jgi:hypothetical protein
MGVFVDNMQQNDFTVQEPGCFTGMPGSIVTDFREIRWDKDMIHEYVFYWQVKQN